MLSAGIRQLERNGSISGYRPCPQAPAISHLLFADDCLLICRAGLDECSALSKALQAYCCSSGQSVNLDKSSLHLGNVVGWV